MDRRATGAAGDVTQRRHGAVPTRRAAAGGPASAGHTLRGVQDVLLRQATPADAEPLAVLHVKTWQVAYRGLVPDALLDAMTVEVRSAAWARMLTEGSRVCLAEKEDRLLGFAAYGGSRDDDAVAGVGELLALYVHPANWSRGVGRGLHHEAVRAMAQEHLEATLWVLEANQRAREFYERQGWLPDGQTKLDGRESVVLREVRYRRRLR